MDKAKKEMDKEKKEKLEKLINQLGEDLGKEFRRYRKGSDLTQEQLRMMAGISRPTIVALEKNALRQEQPLNQTNRRIVTIAAVCAALNVRLMLAPTERRRGERRAAAQAAVIKSS